MFEHRQSRPEEIIWAALFLSALFHLAAILYLKLPEFPASFRAKQALSVILAKPQETSEVSLEPLPPTITPITLPPKEAPITTPEMPIPPPEELARREEPPPPPKISEPLPAPEPVVTPSETLQETPADPIELSSEIIEASKVQALLVIGENGNLHQIIWNVLPALTNETLHQIEQQLRAKTYLATGKTYTLYEIVEMPQE